MSRLRERDPDLRTKVFARDRGICALCGKDTVAVGEKWEADHMLPVSLQGGGLWLDNLRTLCIPCHRSVTRELNQNLRAGMLCSVTRFQIAPPEVGSS